MWQRAFSMVPVRHGWKCHGLKAGCSNQLIEPLKQMRSWCNAQDMWYRSTSLSSQINTNVTSSNAINGHGASVLGKGSEYSSAGWDSSRLARELCLARDNLHTEPCASVRGPWQAAAHRKCSTLGESRIKTQGSVMGLTEMKRRAVRSRGWDSPSHMVFM